MMWAINEVEHDLENYGTVSLKEAGVAIKAWPRTVQPHMSQRKQQMHSRSCGGSKAARTITFKARSWHGE